MDENGGGFFAPYLALIAVLVPFSLVAIGGGPAIFAPLQHESVEVRHWLTAREFVELFAIARVAPGPGSMLSTLIGWKVAGFSGALVAILASCVPTCLLAFFTTRWLESHRDAPWQKYVQAGLAPITVSLILASGWIITLGAARGPVSIAITIATAVAMLKLSVHPLWWIVAGAIAGLLGWV